MNFKEIIAKVKGINYKEIIAKNKNILLIISFVIFLGFFSYSLAKYIDDRKKEFLYEAKAFYFESNYLNDIASVKSYTLEKGIDYVEFDIENNIDQLRYSDVTINYTVTLTDLEGNAVKDKSGASVSPITATLANGSIKKNTHRFSNLKGGVYVVNAISKKPYTKTIRANFIITNDNTSISYSVTDTANSPILQLTVNTNDYNGNIKITWPDGVTPDNTNSLFTDVTSGYTSSNKTISVVKNGEYTFQFFKQNPTTVFVKDNFKVGGVS